MRKRSRQSAHKRAAVFAEVPSAPPESSVPQDAYAFSLRPSKKGPQLLHFKTQGELNAPPLQEESFRSVIGLLPARCSSLRPCLDVLPPLDRRCFPSQLGKIHSFTPHGGGGSSGISSGGGEAAALGGVSDGPTFSAAWCRATLSLVSFPTSWSCSVGHKH